MLLQGGPNQTLKVNLNHRITSGNSGGNTIPKGVMVKMLQTQSQRFSHSRFKIILQDHPNKNIFMTILSTPNNLLAM